MTGNDAITIGCPAPIVPPFSSVKKTFQKQEEIGYDCMWFVDHLMGFVPESIWTEDIVPLAKHVESPHLFFETSTLMAAAGVLTDRIRVGTSVTDLIRKHPAIVAQSTLTLDHITSGRLILGIGAGERENIEPYGISFKNRVSKTREAIEIIRLLWKSTGKVNYEGRFWNLKDAVLALTPYNKLRFPPIWIAAHGPLTFQLTADFGDGWLPIALSVNEYEKGLNKIMKLRKKNGREETKFTPALWSWVIMDEDHDECHRVINSPLGKFYALMMPSHRWKHLGFNHPFGNFNMLLDFVPTRFNRKEILDAIHAVPSDILHEFYIHGDTEDIVAAIETYADVGLEHIILGNLTGSFDPRKTRTSYSIMADVCRTMKKK